VCEKPVSSYEQHKSAGKLRYEQKGPHSLCHVHKFALRLAQTAHQFVRTRIQRASRESSSQREMQNVVELALVHA
jgi:hypothetical protein